MFKYNKNHHSHVVEYLCGAIVGLLLAIVIVYGL
jgi:hypothetical protein